MESASHTHGPVADLEDNPDPSPMSGSRLGPSTSRGSHATRHSLHTLRSTATKQIYDPQNDPNLPYRTVSVDANLDEYRREVLKGQLPGPVIPGTSGKRYKLVAFEPNDPENPKNWSKAFKWYCTMVVAVTCFVVAFSSSVITPGISGVKQRFDVSDEVALLTITVFVVGFGVGPMVFAPLSEIYGRRIVYGITLFIAVIFIIPCAVATNITTLIVCRAIDGIAFSAPMTLVGGTLADMWKNEERAVPMAAFSAAPFLGPAIGPLVGGYLYDGTSWRWLYYIQIILAAVIWILITFTVPETYTPTILARRADRLRKQTGSQEWVTEQELDKRPIGETLIIFILRPFRLLFGELIVLLISLYMSVLYGLLYMFFIAFPIVYGKGKGYSNGKTGLMFIPLAVGVMLSACCSPLVNKHYLKLMQKYNGRPPAEVRLIPMMCACWFIPIGLFIFAWSSYPRLSWAGPALGGFPVGFGFIFLYNSANNYLVDSYQHQAASVLAAKTFIRSLWGASCVLFTRQMYDRLGYQWASSLLAFISLACCLIPFLFWVYGARIRAHSKYAYIDPEELPGSADEEKAIPISNDVLTSAPAQVAAPAPAPVVRHQLHRSSSGSDSGPGSTIVGDH
ncbi:putative MFS-type transporter [Ceratocystis lukuohia]|uniref:MFS-type transporter n=1 Tax=Ceratocystis lukuohia TaxID=2019550 RepID=A0ABR4ME85_9PEZI